MAIFVRLLIGFLLSTTLGVSGSQKSDRVDNFIENIGANRARLLVNILNKEDKPIKEKIYDLFDDKLIVNACHLKGGRKELADYIGKYDNGVLNSVKFTVKKPIKSSLVGRGQYGFEYSFQSKGASGKEYEAVGTAIIDIHKTKFVSVRQPCPVVRKMQQNFE